MNHHIYEDWLFDHYENTEEPLTVQQADELRSHLQSCESCRSLSEAWREVGALLHDAPVRGPRLGFSARWKARLEYERRRSYQRQTVTVLALGTTGAVALIGLLVVLALPWMQASNVLLWTLVYRLFALYAYANAVQDLVTSALQSTVGLIPLTWWVVFMGLLSQLGVLWIVSYRMLTNPRRISK